MSKVKEMGDPTITVGDTVRMQYSEKFNYGWISVKDKLPDERYVLCYQSRSSNPIQVGFRSSHSGEWFPNLYNVTHWMFLPEPPK